jgi:hypothetical protein
MIEKYPILLLTRFSLWNVVSVLVTVSAESINQFRFRFQYRTETKIVVSVVHYQRYSINNYIALISSNWLYVVLTPTAHQLNWKILACIVVNHWFLLILAKALLLKWHYVLSCLCRQYWLWFDIFLHCHSYTT